ncbi:hypothetical protein [Methylomonas sp. DH-1]|uniref:hypothetical protein n=1 Tax=Methylomonas sp. (strain DH-1) TaxID=1727196 RepID=UPI0007C993F9|nr:hypothetical protein [Methylomonas sp. DH-1]ANE54997.1 hypothetical protein AYM39_07275 [Methylomonas sp. DH-1]
MTRTWFFTNLLGAIIVILFAIYLYVANEKLLAVISGLLAGFIVALFQTLLSLKALQKLDKYDNYKIIEILPRRNNRSYYKSLLSNSRKKICVLGVTAQRFLHHFANEEDSEEGANVLLLALCKGVEVKILVTDPKRLAGNDKRKAEIAESQLKELSEKFKGKFKYAYYDHEPMHSIVIVDRESIVGPMFPGLSSEHTPAIHLLNNSEIAENYITYFNNEWKSWWKQENDLAQN